MAWDSYTKLMLHTNGADESTIFTDEIGHSFSVYGNAQIDTAQSKFGGASGLFDGTGDYIATANHADWDFGTGDWTVDFWVRRNGDQAAYAGILCADSSALTGFEVHFGGAGKINKVRLNSKASGAWAEDLLSSSVLSDTTWTHVAIVRYGNTLTMYSDGVSVGSKDCTGYNYSSAGTGLTVGRLRTDVDNYYLRGWIDEVRVSKGIARWTSDFTPPASEYCPVLLPTSISQLLAYGTPTVLTSALTILPSSIVQVVAIGTPVLFYPQTLSPPGIIVTVAYGTPSVGTYGIIVPQSIVQQISLGSPTLLKYVWHVILDGQYNTDSPEVNRVYVIGQDDYGNPIYGTAVDATEGALVGERLDFQQEQAVPLTAQAASVAVAILSKMRITTKKGLILIPPNCGQELFDVVQISDAGANQAAVSFRVVGIRFEYNPKQARYEHRLILGAP
ncbi:MAG: hypothetical protein A2Y72_03675 [Chloroflexi bacterium RBG_13_53_26]|nr:MAG: hypothetical protein A2Y72_03675 [Chloroflexi bacterium RBG_13_53_26]